MFKEKWKTVLPEGSCQLSPRINLVTWNVEFIVAALFVLGLAVRMAYVDYFLPSLGGMSVGLRGDEITYVTGARHILTWIQEGRFQFSYDLQYNYESPMFAKVIFALGIGLFGKYLGDATSVRLTSSVVGAMGTVAVYFLGKRIFQDSALSMAAAIAFSFSPAFFATSTTGLLDGVTASLTVVSFVFIVKKNLSFADLILSGVFLGGAMASKYLAVTAAAISVIWLLLRRESSVEQRFMQVLLLGAVACLIFFLAQPRLWFNPWARLLETWGYYSKPFAQGHPIPVSSLPGGDGSWSGPRTLPHWWLVIYWTVIASTPFQFVGGILLLASSRSAKIAIRKPETWFTLAVFLTPLAYLIAQTAKVGFCLPQYLTLLSLGETLLAAWGYGSISTSRRLAVPIAMTSILSPFEPSIVGRGIDPIFNILFPVWLRLAEWMLILCILGIAWKHRR